MAESTGRQGHLLNVSRRFERADWRRQTNGHRSVPFPRDDERKSSEDRRDHSKAKDRLRIKFKSDIEVL